jgi:hypothetical protein
MAATAKTIRHVHEAIEIALWLLWKKAYRRRYKAVSVQHLILTEPYKLLIKYRIINEFISNGERFATLTSDAVKDLMVVVGHGRLPPIWMARLRNTYGQGRAPLPILGIDYIEVLEDQDFILSLTNRPN